MAKKNALTLVIDFETANVSPTSACELGLIVLKDDALFHEERFLIKPPTPFFTFTSIHGITWSHVKDSPTFGEWWETHLEEWFSQSTHLIAHNIGFDKRVLEATAAHYQIKLPKLTSECTVQLSRKKLGIHPAKLSNVCEELKIPLKHHEALSDAKAAAYIYLFAKTGVKHWKTKVKNPKKILQKDSTKLKNSAKSQALLESLLKKGRKERRDIVE